MKFDDLSPSAASQIFGVLAFTVGMQVVFEFVNLKYVYDTEDYKDTLEREKNIKV